MVTVTREGTDTARKRRALVPELHPDMRNKGFFAEAEGRQGYNFAIARESPGGRVVGYVAWMESRTRGFQPDVTVYGLYGTPGVVRGVGTALMAEVAAVAAEQGASLAVSGMVGTARSFYEQMGADTREGSKLGQWTDAARDALAARRGSGRVAASPALAGTGNS